jgi:hypothetical protein
MGGSPRVRPADDDNPVAAGLSRLARVGKAVVMEDAGDDTLRVKPKTLAI